MMEHVFMLDHLFSSLEWDGCWMLAVLACWFGPQTAKAAVVLPEPVWMQIYT